ncbi:MAG: glycine cleavage system protein GcvH [Candidatus Methanomethylophilaceae archaeon]|jgi:glycine cleavage system H protein|nr:glycine cleavage system protein GcvH [Candidatus Methanomethylophilaceae archaeon]NCA73501.1 glycine cleavage system protein GcvH [Gammaproteobacteria bacterium]MDD2935689.1 glycine cleavage system protein GcvH [Candidatus Methanomethylophilaceae archaeon]MDD3351135.1 glycine cleavage system protein GcvH [Candidatus Methanomethylophilaceae archaeon]MDD3986184.1 glycine cleavage system protein GcvH [Candidatus Methanomethylophilaceae archaeon]
MTAVKEGLLYTKEGTWVEMAGIRARIGLSDRAQEELGEVIYVQPPVVGRQIARNEEIGAIESFKAIAPVISPLSGRVLSVNMALEEDPSLMNTSPYSDGWLADIEMENEDELGKMLSAEEYRHI